jgi:translation initiation factor 4A
VAGNGNGNGSANANANANGNGNGNVMGAQGVAAPGAGIVITKWEHLNLKMELLRFISKYGWVRFAFPLSPQIRETNFDIRIGPPNKIQARVLPFMLKGSDIIAQAPPTQERIIS